MASYLKKVTSIILIFFFLGFSFVFAASIEIVSLDNSGNLSPSADRIQDDVAGGANGGMSSYDGRYVVFNSQSPLVPEDTNGLMDVYVRDRLLGTTERVSVGNLGEQGNGNSSQGSISYDGRYVLFFSTSSNFVADDTNSVADIFVRDRISGTTERVNISTLGQEADVAMDTFPKFKISGNGRYVMFSSGATNLVPGDDNGVIDVFIRDILLGTTERIALDASSWGISYSGQHVLVQIVDDYYIIDTVNDISSILPPLSGGHVSLSGNGQFVTYRSGESCSLSILCVGVYDTINETHEIVSVTSNGNEILNSQNSDPSISHNGRFVSFFSTSTTLVPGYTGTGQDIYIRDRLLGTTEIVSAPLDGTFGNQISRYGSVSPNGFNVIFSSGASNLVVGDDNGVTDIFLYSVTRFPTDILISSSEINEDEDIGTVVGTLSTEDLDIDEDHSYSFTCDVAGADDASFTIDGTSLLSAEVFDYDTKNEYNICIRTEDPHGAFFDKNFVISVIEVVPPTPPPSSSSGSTSVVTVNPPAPPGPILGCTISFATNYNPSANQNDGSCIFPVIEIPGCTNPLAINYSQVANTDNGGCILPTPEIPVEDSAPEEAEEVEETEIQETDSETDEEEIAPQTPPTDKLETNIPTEKPTLDERGEVLGQEEVVRVSENISAAGLALPLIAFVVTQPAVAASIPVRLWSIFPTLLGFKRRKRPWGTVYDSVTKQPLDPVHVSLIDEKGKEVATTITDIDGRFGFLVPAGRYKIIVNKNNYEFPSKKMAGKEGDELYGDLYFSEYVEIKGEEDILIKNIPMDPVNFNWNEFEKSKNKNLMKFYSKREVFFANISGVVFYAGLVSSVFLIITSASVLNSIIFAIYVVVFILKFFNIGPKKPGYVYDSSGFPLSYGIVRVFSAGLNREISHAVIGKTGKYYALVRNGEYYLKISRKTGEDSYEEIHQTDILKVRSGYIKEKISAK